MFPYGDEEKFKEHDFYKRIEEVNIGAFPMLPGSIELITKHLNVMFGNVKNKEHLKVYKENLFYHISVARLKEVSESVEYIAFYQSRESFKEEAGIKYYGTIKEWKEYKRKECTEIKARIGTEDDTKKIK